MGWWPCGGCGASTCADCPDPITVDLTSVNLTDSNCAFCESIAATWVLDYQGGGTCLWSMAQDIASECSAADFSIGYQITTPGGVRTHTLTIFLGYIGFDNWTAVYQVEDDSICPVSSLDFVDSYGGSTFGINYLCGNWDGGPTVWPATVSITW